MHLIMDLFMCCLFIGVLQSFLMVPTEAKRERRRKKAYAECGRLLKFIGTYNHRRTEQPPTRLNSVTVHCDAPTGATFEIRYSDGSLCACNRVKKHFRKNFKCKEKKSLNIKIIVSTNYGKETTKCDVNLRFAEVTNFVPAQVSIDPEKSKPSALSLIGHIPSTSSFSSQSELGHSSTMSWKIASSTTSVPATSLLPTQPLFSTSSLSESQNAKATKVIQVSPTMTYVASSTTQMVVTEKDQIKKDIEFISNFDTSTVDVEDVPTIERVLDAATNLIKTNQTVTGEKQDPGMRAVEVLQDLGNSISEQLDLGNESSAVFEKVTEDLVFGAAVINVTKTSGFSFPSEKNNMDGDEKINIPTSVFGNSGKGYFVGIIFKAYSEMRNMTGDEGFVMGTKVINVIVYPAPSDRLKEPVEMTFEKNIAGKSFASECSFWIENSSLIGEHGRWSTNECFRKFENTTHVKCACYHFTNFAVLFKITDDQNISNEDTFRLVMITYIGLGLSILGCLLTFIIYVSLSNIKSDRAVLHTNLVAALGIADVIFLVAVAVRPVKDSCLALTMLAFYFYLAVFFWMLVEGVYIYLMVIKVFRGNVTRRRRQAYLVGWGCPVLIAIITWAILTDDVVSKYHCWLSVESGAIWAFVAPGLLIILVNCIIVSAVVKKTWATFSDDKEFHGLKSATKTFGAVIPILGITWVFGVMAFNESSIVFQYIFAITNSIQGVLIFILYCLVNKEVRIELQRRFTIWQTRREMTSSSSGRRHILASTQSTQRINDLDSFPAAHEMKEKSTVEENSLLDGVSTTAENTKK